MIFVTVGTWHSGFDRLVQKIDELFESGSLNEKIIAQVGNGHYQPSNFKTLEFCSPQEFDDQISQSRVVVTHAGVGSMMSAILENKPVIVVPRKASLNEADNDHQFNTAKQFEQEGMILVAYEVSQLEDCFEKAKNFSPTANSSGLDDISKEVKIFLNDVEQSKR